MYFIIVFQVDKKVVKTECGVLLKIKHTNVVRTKVIYMYMELHKIDFLCTSIFALLLLKLGQFLHILTLARPETEPETR